MEASEAEGRKRLVVKLPATSGANGVLQYCFRVHSSKISLVVKSMYSLSTRISDDQQINLIPEVAFSPDGSMFAVTHLASQKVVVFDSSTRTALRTYRNPGSRLDGPHGILITDNHMVISNTHRLTRPSSFSVYRLGDSSDQPVSVFETPYDSLREAHSLAIHNGILVATYSENTDINGALVAYRFDDDAGLITATLDILRLPFETFGEPKGVAFTGDGSSIYFTYVTQKPMTGWSELARRLRAARTKWARTSVSEFARYVGSNLRKKKKGRQRTSPEFKNGIAVFSMNELGKFSKLPIRTMERDSFCRLENISFTGDTVVMSDTINGAIYFHDLREDPDLKTPTHTVTEELTLPHGVKLSPDKAMLVVTNYGLKHKNQVIHWGVMDTPNNSGILVYDLQAK